MENKKSTIIDAQIGKLRLVKILDGIAFFDKESKKKVVIKGRKYLEAFRDFCTKALEG